jgi:hypothetical protein
MLRKLFVKDMILNGKVFFGLLWLFVWVAYAAGGMTGPGMATILGAVAATLMTVTLGAREGRFHATAVSFSLPVTRRDIVTYRYLVGHLVGVAAVLLTCLLMVAVPWSKQTAAQVFEPKTMMLALVAVSLTIAMGMPFVLRFGITGLFVGLGGLQILGLLAIVLGAAIGSAFALRPVMGACERIVSNVHQSLGSAAYAIELLSAVALVTWASFRLSVWLIERRDV